VEQVSLSYRDTIIVIIYNVQYYNTRDTGLKFARARTTAELDADSGEANETRVMYVWYERTQYYYNTCVGIIL